MSLVPSFNFAATFAHPLGARQVIEFVPTQWVMALANPEADDIADLTPGGLEVSLEQLWDNMLQNGMRDPFILTAGRHSRASRLEAGNHRIKIFARHSEPYVPATVLVGDDCVVFASNGSHRHTPELVLPVQDYNHHGYDDRTYMAPSAVFREIEALKAQGLLPPPPAR